MIYNYLKLLPKISIHFLPQINKFITISISSLIQFCTALSQLYICIKSDKNGSWK